MGLSGLAWWTLAVVGYAALLLLLWCLVAINAGEDDADGVPAALPKPAAWRVGASYWTHYDSIPAALLPPNDTPEPLYTADAFGVSVDQDQPFPRKDADA